MKDEKQMQTEIEKAVWNYQRMTGDNNFTGIIEVNVHNGIIRNIWIDADEEDDD